MDQKKTISNDVFRLVIDIVLLVLGIILIAEPAGAMVGIVTVLGVILVVAGAVFIVIDIVKRNKGSVTKGILLPLICLVIGIILLIFNAFFANWLLPFVIGVWILIMGIIYFSSSITLKKAGARSWAVSLVVSVASIVLGVLILVGVFAGENILGLMIGISMVIYGILALINWFVVYSAKKKNLIN